MAWHRRNAPADRGPAPRSLPLFVLLALSMLATSPVAAQNNKVRITGLADFDFGTIANFSADRSIARGACVYSSANGTYSIRASGSGSAGDFQLAGPAATLNYEVQWADRASQASGSTLRPNIAVAGLSTNARNQQCTSGPTSSASLIIVLRAGELQAALTGSYTGTLTLIIGAE